MLQYNLTTLQVKEKSKLKGPLPSSQTILTNNLSIIMKVHYLIILYNSSNISNRL